MSRNVDRRAQMHAALGEPVRLAIVDWLGSGDASPGELAELLRMGTNLLAFHLKVLAEAGVIRRVRSEGDRRRSYVQLCLDDPLVRATVSGELNRHPDAGGWSRVVFVCTSNSTRSQLAAATWNRISAIPALAAGAHPGSRIHPRAVAVGRRHGLRLGRARPVTVQGVLRAGDLVVAVCDIAHEELVPSRDRLHWSIPDPVRVDTDEAFETAYDDITRRVERLAATVMAPAVGTEPARNPQPSPITSGQIRVRVAESGG